jgi:hypothetical protein
MLRLPTSFRQRTQPALTVELLEGRSGKKLKSVTTDESGAFDLDPRDGRSG